LINLKSLKVDGIIIKPDMYYKLIDYMFVETH
jgi:hypothetical protein